MTNKNNYTTVSYNVQVKNTFKKSRFYASVKELKKEEEIREFLKELKEQFPDASHHCWAYKIGINEQQIKQYSDAGEPANSAGPPILQAIEQECLTNVMVIVTRYFGGIKLGIGGLIRAYRESALQGLQSAGRVEKFALREFILQGINYKELGPIIQAIESREGRINNINYDEKITVITHLPESRLGWLNDMVKSISHGRVGITCDKIYILLIRGKIMLEKFKGLASPQENTQTIQEIASRNFSKWNSALQTGNPKEVAALYFKDATFLPTTSREFKKGQKGAEEYFTHFLKKIPRVKLQKKKFKLLELIVICIPGCTILKLDQVMIDK